MRRIERLINLVAALLDSARPMSAEDIRRDIAGYHEAASPEAFRRMFERDKEALRSIGIPLEVVATDAYEDRLEAYTIPKARYYLPDIDLEADEIAALKIVADALLGGGEQAEAGVLKLSMDTSSAPWSGPRVVWGADLAAEEPALGPLYSAIIDRVPVSFLYRSARSDDLRDREIEGYGLLHRWGHWYLAGKDRADGIVKSFRVARIDKRIRRLDGSYEVPADFDAAQQLSGETFAIGDKPETVTVRFDATMRWWAEQNMAGAPHRDGPEGALDIDIPVANMDALVSWLIGFGPGLEVIAPESARARVVEHLDPYMEAATE